MRSCRSLVNLLRTTTLLGHCFGGHIVSLDEVLSKEVLEELLRLLGRLLVTDIWLFKILWPQFAAKSLACFGQQEDATLRVPLF